VIRIEANDKVIEGKDGETLLTTLRRGGIHIPTLCHLEGLLPSGACRMCVVEVEGQNGLVPSCAFPVRDGMKVHTHTRRATRARKTIIELLLANHPDDCLYCSRNKDCQLQDMAAELGVRQRRYSGGRCIARPDISSLSVVREPAKCILCGKCVRVCEEVQSVSAIDFIGRGSHTKVGPAFDTGLHVSSCVDCGQCILACPTGALSERSSFKNILSAIDDPKKHVLVQHAPAVSVTLGELFGAKPGVDVAGLMTAALRRLGFDRVFDTSFAADLTIMEEASELVQRITQNQPLPMFTSCCPAWVDFAEQNFADLLPNLSTCKSPQQMLGAVLKSWYAKREGIDPKDIFTVAVMPCTAKKTEARTHGMDHDGVPDVDAVLTTRELARIIRMRNIDLASLEPEAADTPFGGRSTAGKLFGASGGVMEAAIRTAHVMVTGKEMDNLKVQAVRGMQGVKEGRVKMGDLEVGVAVVSGLANARKLANEVRAGRKDIQFIEVMACPGGCINGGGQPIGADIEAVKARAQALYLIDRDGDIRTSHANRDVQRLYDEFLGKPLGHESHRLLHTEFKARNAGE
jgi:NADH-quinone oxidoreductase subunit G/NADP-reducing hydrogenase subunit HndD